MLLKVLIFLLVWVSVVWLFMGPMNTGASPLLDVFCAAGWALLTQFFERLRFISV